MIQQLLPNSHNEIKELSGGSKTCITIIHLVQIHLIYLLPTLEEILSILTNNL
jgi:hypothetical protein